VSSGTIRSKQILIGASDFARSSGLGIGTPRSPRLTSARSERNSQAGSPSLAE
jgi:hypothetical protein